jgi:hypothetical protein
MLSLTSGKPIAFILDKAGKETNKRIFIKETNCEDDDDIEAELDTTRENKQKIFKKFIQMDKRLSLSDMNKLNLAYKNELEQNQTDPSLGKLERKYENGKTYVNQSLKKFVQYDSSTDLFPLIDAIGKQGTRIFISGQSGSGKSYFVKELLKHNKIRKGTGVYLFSPVVDDESLNGIKNLIPINLDTYHDEFEKEFEIEDIPKHSVVVFDDIESARNAKLLMAIRDQFLERSRHSAITTITISHNPMGNNKTKASVRECQYAVLFPQSNPRDTGALLKAYFGYTTEMINEILALRNSRWILIHKHVPSYWVSQHAVRLQ